MAHATTLDPAAALSAYRHYKTTFITAGDGPNMAHDRAKQAVLDELAYATESHERAISWNFSVALERASRDMYTQKRVEGSIDAGLFAFNWSGDEEQTNVDEFKYTGKTTVEVVPRFAVTDLNRSALMSDVTEVFGIVMEGEVSASPYNPFEDDGEAKFTFQINKCWAVQPACHYRAEAAA